MWFIDVGHGLDIQAIVWLASDVASPDGHVLHHAPWVQHCRQSEGQFPDKCESDKGRRFLDPIVAGHVGLDQL